MDIGEVAKRANMATSTLRFYEEKGLIKSIGRHGLRRQYGKQVLDQLALIALGRAAGFSLTEIAQMFSQEGQPELDREMLNQKAEQLEQMTRRLHLISEGLRHAAVCPAENHMQCPTFQKYLKAAIAGEYQPTKLE
ncbi:MULTISPECIES: helix-turn-helix domain-containing protein [Acinetobacter]|jgi:DNA-binding transcriptional MerR regulator|uniref:helix-turn-helix domain-containing protein n=1 Tax=Acinetobacter TaxID=469 RepID=UPI000B3CFA12|nr:MULTISPECIES: helix-turn-helix domain-containing protein [Acinetobacter]AXY61464.1 MerR family transcriptional regulator [Acinetobacter sp. WCHAc010052]WOE41755.1 helix-turn-helix domain-containing protein [Acinetobacter chinensis]